MNQTFPKEENLNKVYIKNNILYYTEYGYEESVNLSILQYAYAEVLAEEPYLFLFDYCQHYISVKSQDFSIIYTLISQQFEFNDALFFKIINQKSEKKERIWLKKQAQNYKILNTNFDDFELGFEIQSLQPQFFSWETTYKDFFNSNTGEIYQSEFDTKIFKFSYPVRIGNIVLDSLEFNAENDRLDIPVETFFTQIYHSSQNQNSYLDIKKRWLQDIPTDDEDLGYERQDQWYSSFDLNDVYFSLVYTFEKESGYDDGSTSISINNRRDYSDKIDVYKNNDALQIDQFFTFKESNNFALNYKENSKIFKIPELIKTKAEGLDACWLDKFNNELGFTHDQFAVIYSLKSIDKIIIQNVLPAKGGGYSELIVLLHNKQFEVVYYSNLYAFDPFIDTLKNNFEIIVEVPEPYYNC